MPKTDLQKIHQILRSIAHMNVFLYVVDAGPESDLIVEAYYKNGTLIEGACDLFQMSPDGKFIETGLAGDDRSSIEILAEQLGITGVPTALSSKVVTVTKAARHRRS